MEFLKPLISYVYEVIIFLLFGFAVYYTIISFPFLVKEKKILERFKIVISAIVAGILIVTGLLIAKQARETRRAVNLQKYNIEIQNQPVVNLHSFYYTYAEEVININSMAECFGTTPAHEFERIKDIIFYIEPLESKVNNFIDKNELTKLHFYFYELVHKISNHIVKNPKITEADLIKYLDKIKDSKEKITVDVVIKPELTLDFKDYTVFQNIKNWRRYVGLFPVGKKEHLNTTRVTGDLLKDIKNYKKIFIYYCVYKYEGLVKGEKIKSSYLGYLAKSPYSDLKNVKLKFINRESPIDGYPLSPVKIWVARKPIPK